MIKKLIIWVIVVIGAVIFYKKFLADTLETFFGKHANNVDLYQLNFKEPEVKE